MTSLLRSLRPADELLRGIHVPILQLARRLDDLLEHMTESKTGETSSTRALLVMQAFNEDEVIPEILEGLAAITTSCDILVVDDASVVRGRGLSYTDAEPADREGIGCR